MIKIKRYERFLLNERTMYYDRVLHSLVRYEKLENNSVIPVRMKDINNSLRLAIYPGCLLRYIKIPQLVIETLNAISIVSFLGTIIMCMYDFSFIQKLDYFPSILITPILIFLSVFLHEIAHAIVGVNLGGFVAEVGLIKDKCHIRYYTKIYWDANHRAKVLYYFSGIAMNMALGGGAFVIMKFSANAIWFLLFVVNVLLAFGNAMPNRKRNTDGYNITRNIKDCRNLKIGQ